MVQGFGLHDVQSSQQAENAGMVNASVLSLLRELFYFHFKFAPLIIKSLSHFYAHIIAWTQ